jgi:anti-sigma factor RsiW
MSRREDEELMAFLDGELPPRDARQVEARLDASAEEKQKAEALGELSQVLRGHYEAASEASEKDLLGAWAKLEQALDAEPAPERKAARQPSDEPGGLMVELAEWFSARWGYLVTGAVAAAAGWMIATRYAPEKVRIEKQYVEVPAPAPAPVVTASAQATEIEELEVATGSGMVFQVPSDDNDKPATTVVWVTDDTATGEPI